MIKTLNQSIKSLSIQHSNFVKDIQAIERYADEVDFNGESSFILVWGRPGSGKTARLNHFRERYTQKILKLNSVRTESNEPLSKFATTTEVPVVKIELLKNPTVSSMTSAILKELDVPPGRARTDADKTNHALNSLKLAKTRVVIFDEAQHLYEATSQKSDSAKLANSRNWLKSFGNQLGILIVLSGLETIHHIYGDDFQLERRTVMSIPVNPFDWNSQEGKVNFLGILKKYEEEIKQQGYQSISFLEGDMPKRFYYSTGGYIGVLTGTLQSVAVLCSDYKKKGQRIELDDLSKAFKEFTLSKSKEQLQLGNAFPNAFELDYDFKSPMSIDRPPKNSVTLTEQSLASILGA
jgi:hypothetical protein